MSAISKTHHYQTFQSSQGDIALVLSGKGIDETEIVSQLKIPLAVVAGTKDRAINPITSLISPTAIYGVARSS